MRLPIRAPGRPSLRRPSAALLAAAIAVTMVFASAPTPATATTATPAQMGSLVVSLLNQDRAARGLRPVRGWGALSSLATDRAQRMASSGILSHAAAGGNVGTALTARGIQWYTYGEIIGMSDAPWGSQSAEHIYSMWKASPSHVAIMFSSTLNYVGTGFAYRSVDGTTWSSLVFTESNDRTGAVARNGSLTRSGTSVTFRWSGYDPLLQTHTSGLRSFDVLVRRDYGSWVKIRNDTTARWLTLTNRAHGHWYGFKVQAADRRGNLSSWTREIRIWVP